MHCIDIQNVTSNHNAAGLVLYCFCILHFKAAKSITFDLFLEIMFLIFKNTVV